MIWAGVLAMTLIGAMGAFFLKAGMDRVDSCIHCDHCKSHCPFGLDTPALLASQKVWYDGFYQEHMDEAEK